METGAHATAAVSRVLITLAGAGGDALHRVVVGGHQVVRVRHLLLLQPVDVV